MGLSVTMVIYPAPYTVSGLLHQRDGMSCENSQTYLHAKIRFHKIYPQLEQYCLNTSYPAI